MFDFFKKKPKPEPAKTGTPHDVSEQPIEQLAAEQIAESAIDDATEPNIEPAQIPEQANTEPAPVSALDDVLAPLAAPAQILEQVIAEPFVEAVPDNAVAVLAIPEPTAEQPIVEAEPDAPVRSTLSKSFFARTFGSLFSRNPKLDAQLLDDLEMALISADVGAKASAAIIAPLQKRFKSREFADAKQLVQALREQLTDMLRPIHKPLLIDKQHQPFVLLTVGVNGVGKTTTIGKLARRFQTDGHSLMLAAGDTFRAAAVQQLQIWGERNHVAVIAQGQDADPASVAFDALQAAKSRGIDILIVDTAGRLHTQTHLMAELSKVKRVLSKLDPGAPHEVLLIIDGSTGQNAINQCRAFNEAVGVTGLVVTKLDGSAKGGVLFALASEFGIPIRFIGLGEKPEDLRAFEPESYVNALLPHYL